VYLRCPSRRSARPRASLLLVGEEYCEGAVRAHPRTARPARERAPVGNTLDPLAATLYAGGARLPRRGRPTTAKGQRCESSVEHAHSLPRRPNARSERPRAGPRTRRGESPPDPLAPLLEVLASASGLPAPEIARRVRDALPAAVAEVADSNRSSGGTQQREALVAAAATELRAAADVLARGDGAPARPRRSSGSGASRTTSSAPSAPRGTFPLAIARRTRPRPPPRPDRRRRGRRAGRARHDPAAEYDVSAVAEAPPRSSARAPSTRTSC